MSNFNIDSLHGYLYCLFEQKKSAKTAYRMLLNVTKTEVMSYREIEKLFHQMRSGDFDMKIKQAAGTEGESLFPIMPLHVLKQIVDDLDIESRLCLGNTCQPLAFAVNDSHFHIRNLVIQYDRKHIGFYADEKFHVVFEDVHGGCLVRKNGDMKVVKENTHDYYGELFLKSILRIRKLKVDVFAICGDDEPNNTETTLSGYTANRIAQAALKSREEKLKVKHFHVEYLYHNVLACLPYFDVKSLEKVSIESGGEPVTCSQEVFETEIFKNLKNFTCDVFAENEIILKHSSQLDSFKLDLSGSITTEQFFNFIMKLLENAKLRKAQLRVQFPWNDSEAIKTELQKYKQSDDSEWSEFLYPNCEGKLLIHISEVLVVNIRGPCYTEEDEDDEINQEEFNIGHNDGDVANDEDNENGINDVIDFFANFGNFFDE